MSNLIINEPPLIVLPTLAVSIGLNEALFIQQLHYWLSKSNVKMENRNWIYKTLDEWKRELPFWSKSTIKRTISSLKSQKILLVKKMYRYEKLKNHYAIDYKSLRVQMKFDKGSAQNEPAQNGLKQGVNMNPKTVQNDPSYKENTKETNKREKEKIYKKKSWKNLEENERNQIIEEIKKIESSILPINDFINSLEAKGYQYADFVKAYQIWVSRAEKWNAGKTKQDSRDPNVVPSLNNLPPRDAYIVEEW